MEIEQDEQVEAAWIIFHLRPQIPSRSTSMTVAVGVESIDWRGR